MTAPQFLNILGLLANAAGVVILFRYGMPYRVALDEGEIIITENVAPDQRALDGRYRKLGYLGLALILLGTGLQIWSTLNP